MLVVLTVVAVGLLSLSTISIKSSSISSAEERARSNARMALMMAIDRLQAQMGPDQRISANAAILSTSSVANPQWMGVWDSWRAGGGDFDRYPDAQSTHATVFRGQRGDPVPASMHPTYRPNRDDHFREWLVSLDDDNARILASGRSLLLNAAYMPDQTQDAVVLVGQGTLGEGVVGTDLVKASLIPVDNTTAGGSTGRYGWWVGDESQKGSIMGDPYDNRNDLTEADRLFRMQAAGSMGTESVEELSNITNLGKTQLGSVATRKTLDLIDGAIERPLRAGMSPTGPSGNFHDLTTQSRAVLTDVREGGLKRDLSTILEREIVPLASESGVSDINDFMLYRFTAKDGLLGTPEPQEIVPIHDLAAYYQLYNRGNSTSEAGTFGQDITARGVQYNSSYLSGAPHLMSVNYGTRGTSPIYPREYTSLYRQPRIIKVQYLLSLFAIERDNWRDEANRSFPLNRLNSHELLIGITPSITFWNPTNLPIFMQMDPNQVVSQMTRFNDNPLQLRFRKQDRYGLNYTSNFASVSGLATAGGFGSGGTLFSLYWSGRHSVFLEPGEVKTFSLPYSGDLSSLKAQLGYNGHWNQGGNMANFFFKTDQYFEGHEVRAGWEPESYIMMESSAGPNEPNAPLPGQPDTRNVVDGRLRFKAADRITIEIGSGGNHNVVSYMVNQSSYQDYRYANWDRYNTTVQSRHRASTAYNQALFARGLPGGALTTSAPSRTGSSIIARSRFAAGWPFLQYSFMAGCETSESSNAGIMGGRKFPSRPFLHSSPIYASPFLDDNTGEALYNFGYNWSANLINDVYEAPVQINRNNQGYYGGGYTSESGTTHVIQQEIPVTPPISIAALSHAHLGGFSVCQQDCMPYGGAWSMGNDEAQYRRHLWTRAVGFGGLYPFTVQAIGNSYAHPQIPADQAYTTLRRNLNERTADATVTFADHSYLANKALWDEFFFSSITPQQSHVEIFDTSREALDVAQGFFFDDEKLPNSRMLPYKTDIDEDKLDGLFAEYDLFLDGMADKIAAHLMVNGPFNINSTSVEAWKVLFSSMRGKPVPYKTPSDAINGRAQSVDSGVDGTPVGQFGLGGGRPYTGRQNNPNTPDQWTSMRELTDNEIEELAEAMVEQVKLRGPFLSLSEFVNRRLDSSNDEFAAKGALQAALDDDSVSINAAFRTNDREFSNSEVSAMGGVFNEAAAGSPSYGSAAYVDQADILRNFAAQLTPRGDTFVIRCYGDSLDANGNVEARAWCEAVVQRLPDYVEPLYQSSTGDQAHTKYADLQSASNRIFGRKMEVVSFRWLHPSEI